MSDLPLLATSLLDALEEPALLVQRERTIAANAAALRLLGDSILGTDVRLAVRQPHALRAVLAARPADLEVSGIGGLERSWDLQVRPLEPDLLLVRLTDRSATRAAEKMRVDFVANASHELRTPLATIIGYGETLAEDGDFPSEHRSRFGRAIHDEARRMLRIVQDLMSLSRIEADRFVPPDGRLDLAEIARIAAENGRRLAESRGCRVVADVADGLPQVPGDFTQLLQLADNLVGNAVRYGCGPGSPEVLVGARQERDAVLLSVRDRGEGIAAVHLPRLTERFYRVDAARSRDSGGTGLGLAIVKHIVERHRGTLAILSKPGEGTEVQVRLPLA
ncbi:MAG: Phosphate regulon sensor protein PhoR (SphS) [uncultured Sphingomonas sp.]|uniref:histidine kinase n=1 Tax=uncultured Sphingomonas sp. TaxID=158754 RepID=A0A6J4TSX3_9SPHN|nr:ATP-binding protein [uncultured Sphingomonas sp.]CAA9531478.1 MAG: Phosphate regulon sensor protein PhoR (SphS) [uncultured Sphingomonas sp.]